ncbi:hypothetical protein BC834DRAFT_847734 [Gloeopeniophorella convolvens]|nr:hypothetical protein BC834DRAFT_847734 [Gloeopeniophorella convolvens]
MAGSGFGEQRVQNLWGCYRNSSLDGVGGMVLGSGFGQDWRACEGARTVVTEARWMDNSGGEKECEHEVVGGEWDQITKMCRFDSIARTEHATVRESALRMVHDSVILAIFTRVIWLGGGRSRKAERSGPEQWQTGTMRISLRWTWAINGKRQGRRGTSVCVHSKGKVDRTHSPVLLAVPALPALGLPDSQHASPFPSSRDTDSISDDASTCSMMSTRGGPVREPCPLSASPKRHAGGVPRSQSARTI